VRYGLNFVRADLLAVSSTPAKPWTGGFGRCSQPRPTPPTVACSTSQPSRLHPTQPHSTKALKRGVAWRRPICFKRPQVYPLRAQRHPHRRFQARLPSPSWHPDSRRLRRRRDQGRAARRRGLEPPLGTVCSRREPPLPAPNPLAFVGRWNATARPCWFTSGQLPFVSSLRTAK